MSKVCAKCEKLVYPTEELKCLDKVWHKACFKCWECGMTLNMKNYKGYDKKPYCQAHYPTTKFTPVADTPENQRLATNTKNQSLISYHSEFEKNVGKYTFVPDNPENERIRKTGAAISDIEYRGVRRDHNEMEAKRSSGVIDQTGDPSQRRAVGSIANYDPLNNNFGSLTQGYVPSGQQRSEWEETVPEPRRDSQRISMGPGIGIQVLPMGAGDRQSRLPGTEATTGYSRPDEYQPPAPSQQQQQQRQQQAALAAQQQQLAQAAMATRQSQVAATPTQPSPQNIRRNPLAGAVFQAAYDYTAADRDEVSFNENDIIVDCEPIDDGWMFGTVRRTGLRGMLPSNYVERIQ